MRITILAILSLVFVAAFESVSTNGQQLPAQQLPGGGRHFLQRSDVPPGTVSTQRIVGAGHAIQQYYQAVRFEGPAGSRVSLSNGQDFLPNEPGPLIAGLLVGPAYRIKITDIPYQTGVELFPTVELLDKLCPPPGLETTFPIPIVLTQEDLETAAAGGMVTRVIYLEDPQTALPIADKPGTQRHFDVQGVEDPLHVADQLGKPIAIVRIGSRVAPDRPELMAEFLLGSPPWLPVVMPTPIEASSGPAMPISYEGPATNGFSPTGPVERTSGLPQTDRTSLRR